MHRQNFVDLLPVVDAGFKAGGEDHVFEDRHGEGIASGPDKLVGLVARQAERKGEGHRSALRHGTKLVADNRRIGLSVDVRGLVHGRRIAAEPIPNRDNQACRKRRIGTVQVGRPNRDAALRSRHLCSLRQILQEPRIAILRILVGLHRRHNHELIRIIQILRPLFLLLPPQLLQKQNADFGVQPPVVGINSARPNQLASRFAAILRRQSQPFRHLRRAPLRLRQISQRKRILVLRFRIAPLGPLLDFLKGHR